MLRELPPGLTKYSETQCFDETSVPEKLTSAHNTKPGVWGKLVVLSGELHYVIPGPPEERHRVNAGDYAVIEPTIVHFVELTENTSFRVEFYR